ncbi:MAG TPA: hypothetical protein ENI51_07925, partial [Candidatus Atribacteria bacterium]|nr:hypothetical protein [Candidatus Atribacteria bacterium]
MIEDIDKVSKNEKVEISDFINKDIFEKINVIPADLENWEFYKYRKFPKNELNNDVAYILGESSNHLVVLNAKGEFSEILDYMKDFADTYIEKVLDNEFNFFYFIENCKIDSETHWFPPRPDINTKISIEIYSKGKIKRATPINTNEIRKLDYKSFESKILERFQIPLKKDKKEFIVKIGETFNGVIEIYLNQQGIKRVRTTKKGSLETPLIDVPIYLRNVYLTQNNRRVYEIEIDNEIIHKNKEEILEFIESERNYSYITGRELKSIINIILRAQEKYYKIKPQRMYPAIGVFCDEYKNLIVAYPGIDEITLFGENSLQEIIINECKKKGIDKNGNLTYDFYKILHLDCIPERVRIMTMGHTLISCFCSAIKDYLSVFPNFFWISPVRGVGKTTFFELMYNILFGTQLKTKDDINTAARLTKNATAHTSVLYLDDIDKLSDDAIAFLKTNSTRKKGRERLRKTQELDVEDTYACYAGTGNTDEFLNEDEAFRGRCLITYEINEANKDELNKFKAIYENIKMSPIYGYFLLKKSIEFIDRLISEDIPTSEKLVKRIKINYEKIRDYLEARGMGELDDRRYEIYSLIYTGLEMWDYVFKCFGLNSELLNEYLNIYENDKFFILVEMYEKNDIFTTYKEIENVISFFENNYESFTHYLKREKDGSEVLVVCSDFINAYDEWAAKR